MTFQPCIVPANHGCNTRTEALQFLAGYDPGTFDAILDAVEPGDEDSDPDAVEGSVPFCVKCGQEIGIFLRYGLGWQHYRDHGNDMTYGRFEVLDAGHAPVLAWRPGGSVPYPGTLDADKETGTLMPATLRQLLLAPETMPRVVTDCRGLIEQELSAKSGVSGTAVKAAYKVITTFALGYYQAAIEEMLPDLTDKLEPFWADFNASGGAQFGDYLAKRGGEVSEALLSVTDGRAAAAKRPVLVKTYKAVRGGAGKHIEAALPNLGALVQKYAA